MRKKLSYLAILLFSLMLLSPLCVFAENPAIIDGAGYLTQEEISELSAYLDRIRNEYGFDVAVVIEETMSGYDAESTADDIFDYNGYGLGSGKDGILLYISKEPRNYHYTTHGYGETAFNDRGLEYVDNRVLPYLQNDDYYNAIYTYANTSEELLAMAADGKPYNRVDSTTMLVVIAAVILLPFIVAGFMTKTKMKQMHTAVSQDYADSYIKQGSMNLTNSRDVFLYSAVTKKEKPKSSGGGHTSSSGEHHGGRGGSY